jgi:uncharacterized protein (DUF4415 family)
MKKRKSTTRKRTGIVRYTIDELKRMPSKTDWKRLDAMSDDDIDCSDIPPLDKAWFKGATLVIPQPKKPISLRIDPEIYTWFKRQGPRYQSRINAVLKAYMEAHRK